MCMGSPPPPPDPPPLAPPPPPPPPPEKPVPQPQDLDTEDINPAVRPATDGRDKDEKGSGTGADTLLIEPEVQTGTGTAGGTNVPR